MGKLFDRNTIHNFAALILVISLLSIGILVTIQEAGGLLDPFKTIANTSKEFLIHYNNTYNKKRIVILEGATLIDGTATPTMPQVPLGNPFFAEMFVHVSPPSVLFQRLLPSPPLSML